MTSYGRWDQSIEERGRNENKNVFSLHINLHAKCFGETADKLPAPKNVQIFAICINYVQNAQKLLFARYFTLRNQYTPKLLDYMVSFSPGLCKKYEIFNIFHKIQNFIQLIFKPKYE